MALMHLDTTGFQELLRKIDALGVSIREPVEEALEKAGRKIGDDTVAGLAKPNLPAQGRYSQGDTEKSVIRDPKTHWDGMAAWVPIGFNFGQPGAGGFLIGGTPRMAPDKELWKIYKSQKYKDQVAREMFDKVWEKYLRTLEG